MADERVIGHGRHVNQVYSRGVAVSVRARAQAVVLGYLDSL